MSTGAVTVTEVLDAHVGQETPGGCDHCDAVQAIGSDAEFTGIYRITIYHDDDCPNLAHHRQAPLRQRLTELREAWTWWNEMDPERVAADTSIDLVPEALTDAGGDRLLAVTAWRAGRLAELEVLGRAIADQLEVTA